MKKKVNGRGKDPGKLAVHDITAPTHLRSESRAITDKEEERQN